MTTHRKKTRPPRRIRLDASTVCQLKCRSCPTAAGETGKTLGQGFLKFDDFKDVLRRNPSVSHVELSNWGEIFLNKDLSGILRYAYRHNVALSAKNGANLNHVSDEVLEALVKYKFRELNCSIDGASQETYSVYRVNGNFDRVIGHIKMINRFKAKYRSPYPALKWQFVAFGHNEHEIATARRMALDLNMKFFLKLSWDDLYMDTFSPVKDVELVRRESGVGAADREEYRRKHGMEYALNSCCLGMWSSPQVNYDGRLLGCCINYWDDYGNVFTDGFERCLNSDKFKAAKAAVMGRGNGGIEIPCLRCRYYKMTKESGAWHTEADIEENYAKSRALVMLENKVFGEERSEELARWWTTLKQGITVLKAPRCQSLVTGVGRPAAKLSSAVYPLTIPLEPDESTGWKPYPLFRGATSGLRELGGHASVLIQNRCPHLPHAHKDEELLLLLSGEVDLIFPDKDGSGGNRRRRLRAGQFVYYPAYFSHTLQAVSTEPANYLMFKWHGRKRIFSRHPDTPSPNNRVEGSGLLRFFHPIGLTKGCQNDNVCLGFGQFAFNDPPEDSARKNGFYTQRLFEGPTACLSKLHCHMSKLTPGSGYASHADDYDVVIVVLEGEVETLGRRAGPHSVIFYAAGEPHGMRNPGQQTAKYVVFEFHGRKFVILRRLFKRFRSLLSKLFRRS